MINKNEKIITIALAIVISLAAVTIIYVNLPQKDNLSGQNNIATETPSNNEETTLLIVSFEGEQKNYTLSDLEQLEEYSGNGSYIKTKLLPDTVIIKGPYNFTGVKVSTLLDDFDNLPENYNITVTASDGWSKEFTKDNVNGVIDVYNETGEIIGDSSATMVLAYKENGEYLTNDTGGPLRIVFVGDNVITASNLWVKMVVSIEITEVEV
ncbi:MAG: hypothetical protein DRM99_02755 [Thermoplasmata archaeon]|nr:MAG: hypothetical protein DRM99_02755 [Thermoplasmata archaeon]